MQTSGNVILVTGGGSGIGRRLAEAFHARDNAVIITGRDLARLDAVAAANAGMTAVELDVTDAAAVRRVVEELIERQPRLNALINNAGVMIAEDLTTPQSDLSSAETTVATNLLGPIRMTAALLPHLQRQPRSTIVNVSSGLAFVPLACTPTYSATKAGVHAYTLSLRRQLEGTNTEVVELVPPAVQTDLMPGHATDPRAMPLDAFIAEVMGLVEANPTPAEICVERVKLLRNAEAEGRFDDVFDTLNPRTPLAA